MSGTLTTPTVGQPNSTEDPKVATAVSTLNGNLDSSNKLDGAQLSATSVAAAALASNAVTTAKITDANVTDAKLANPNNGVYRTLISMPFTVIAGTTSSASAKTLNSGSGGWVTSASIGSVGQTIGLPVFDFLAADYTVGSLTTKFRVKMQVMVGSTSPSTVTFNGGLYPLSVSTNDYALGTVVTGSTTGTTATPSLTTSTISRYASSDFAASALTDSTTYSFGVVVGSITVPSSIAIAFQLQMRHV